MITPEQASVLKPLEVEWLRAAERLCDRKMRESYGGVEVTVKLSLSPFARDVQILLRHYGAIGWNNSFYSTANGYQVTFFAKNPVEDPAFPGDEPQAVAEVTETAWDKIRESE